MVSRTAKNRYCWNGVNRLSEATLKSRTMATLLRNSNKIDQDADHSKTVSTLPHTSSKIDESAHGSISSNSHEPIESHVIQLESRPTRKDRSLGVLTLRFIGLFLQSAQGTVSLDSAAVRLVEGDAEPNKLKTITRRLYDIANVLCALRLIERATGCGPCRKPEFKLCQKSNSEPGTSCSAESSARADAEAPGSEPLQKRTVDLAVHSTEPCPKRCKPEQRLSNINSHG
jgi:hypothetical protein